MKRRGQCGKRRRPDEAQVLLVNIAKDLAAKGEIVITKQRGDEELVY